MILLGPSMKHAVEERFPAAEHNMNQWQPCRGFFRRRNLLLVEMLFSDGIQGGKHVCSHLLSWLQMTTEKIAHTVLAGSLDSSSAAMNPACLPRLATATWIGFLPTAPRPRLPGFPPIEASSLSSNPARRYMLCRGPIIVRILRRIR